MKQTVYPIAKINLGLYITSRRPDGYHNIETVFYPIPLCDELSLSVLEEGHDDQFVLSGIELQGDARDNLVMKALRSLRRDHHIPPLLIELHKRIPSGAGLGGGSSDAAYMMKTLNSMFSLGLTDEELEMRVGRLGADCAFFIKSAPRLATGIGNQFSPMLIDLSGYHLVLVKPNVFVSTKEAYAMVRPSLPAYPLRQSLSASPRLWRQMVFNDFEQSVFAQHPELAEIKDRLYQLGAEYACMSGSGSCLFALFKTEPPVGLHDVFSPAFTYCREIPPLL
ncbi:MAG: 4-(cytidine 5'-diphospho)-2-C-methyl-D-erythritol kinase [Bacteroidales bacterium]|nr:4-(cytidine 5'-diphospho)-2-C-methyl-D-erythritol kinase [Candidatus Physcousia equi]